MIKYHCYYRFIFLSCCALVVTSISGRVDITLDVVVSNNKDKVIESLEQQMKDDLTDNMSLSNGSNIQKRSTIDVVFSDLDGTLIHYPSNLEEFSKNKASLTDMCILPASSTGMVGIVSFQTLQLIQQIRQTDVKFVLVSGMRTSTLLNRLPYLPKADAYCSEAGGRIFYPTNTKSSLYIQPKPYLGASFNDLHPFYLIEDIEWRRKMEQLDAAGKDGYIGHEIFDDDQREGTIPLNDRKGTLWEFANKLEEQGYRIDIKGYSTCFRINRKHQIDSNMFDVLLNQGINVPIGLSTSTNLGCIDVYPSISGKKNCCEYIYEKLGFNDKMRMSERCLCLCDDDNDLEMALSCLHVYVPIVTSTSMNEMIQLYPTKFTVTSTLSQSLPTSSTTTTEHNDIKYGTEATEKALRLVLERIKLTVS